MKVNLVRAFSVGVLLLLPGIALASAPITFGDVLPGSVINTAYQSSFGLTFTSTGANPFGQDVFADNPGFPANPVPENNALVGIYSPIQVTFAPTVYSDPFQFRFDVVPDPQGFGTSSAPVQFFNAQNTLIGTLNINQTMPGTYSIDLTGVATALFPADAYYDNLQSVPEPGMVTLLGAGLVALTGVTLRRRVRR